MRHVRSSQNKSSIEVSALYPSLKSRHMILCDMCVRELIVSGEIASWKHECQNKSSIEVSVVHHISLYDSLSKPCQLGSRHALTTCTCGRWGRVKFICFVDPGMLRQHVPEAI